MQSIRKNIGAEERKCVYTYAVMKMNRIFLVVLLAVAPALAQDKQVVIERVEVNGKEVNKDLQVRIKTKGAEYQAKTNAEGFIVPNEALKAGTNDLVDVIITVAGHVLNVSDLHTSNFNVHWQLLGINTPPFDPPSDADLVYFIHFAGEPGRVRSQTFKYDKKPKSVPTGLFEKPERLKLNGIGEPDPNVDYYKQKYIHALFYPIGWSRDGKFAYLWEPADEACGCYFAEIVIQDLKTDKIVWKEKYDHAVEPKIPETIDTVWPTVQKRYSAKLRQYKIEPIKGFSLVHPQIAFDGDVLTPKVNVDIEHDGIYEVEGSITVQMMSEKLGTKTLSRKVYLKKDLNAIRDAMITGSLISPFEPRAAVIVVEEHRGYEGPPNITKIRIVGSTLNSGFKK